MVLQPKGFLFFSQNTSIRSSRVIVENAIYKYSESDDDADETKWIFRYEYSRIGQPNKPHSHFHINAAHHHLKNVDYRHFHFPTSRLSIEQILAHLLQEHGVQPRNTDVMAAVKILAASHKKWLALRTDSKKVTQATPFP